MAGVLTIGSKVYATSIPHLILAEDTVGSSDHCPVGIVLNL